MKKLLFLLVCLIGGNVPAQSVVINEIITSNTTVITDEDGSYEDWIELYNAGTTAVNLQGYGLSDNPATPYFWVFPEYWLQPGAHLLVWCSDKNRTVTTAPLHTNFKISSGGETLTLTRPDGTVADSYAPLLVPQNFTYGRQTDGGSTFVFFPQPTPGTSNGAVVGYAEVLAPPTFSVQGGFFTESFTLTLSHPDPAVTIIYTTDGSDPNSNNLNGTTYFYKNVYPEEIGALPSTTFLSNSFQSQTYTAPLTIADRTTAPNDISMISSTFDDDPSFYLPSAPIYKGTVVRARAYKPGALASPIVTESYFVHPQGLARFGLPVMSVSIDENKFFDYNEGIYVAGVDFYNWRFANPNTQALWYSDSNYDRSGDSSERVGSINYFVNGNEVLNQQVGIRINGGGTRQFQNKSLRLYARPELGAATFNYPVFSGDPFSGYKRLIMRNSGNDFFNTYYKDAFTHDLIKKTGLDFQLYQPSIVFLNGEYWGMLNLRERLDRHYFERKYGITESDIEIIADGYQVDEGTDTHFQALFTYLQNNSLASSGAFDYLKTQMDVDNFRDYFITNIFIQNTDWPGWNTLFWRKNVPFTPNALYGNDGRWRTAIKDTDAGFSLMYDINDHNTLEFATATGGTEWPNPEWSTLILRRLLENDAFKLGFINRFADMMNTYFLPERVIGLSEQFAAGIESEIFNQIDRWAAPFDDDWWYESQDVIANFATVRPEIQRTHIREKFGITANVTTTLDVNEVDRGYIQINTIALTADTPGVAQNPYPWNGIYFQNIPVTVKAIALPGYSFSHWSGAVTSTDAEITYTPTADFALTAHFIPTGQGPTAIPIYFWMMDAVLANDTPLTSIASTYEVGAEGQLVYTSCLVGYPFSVGHPNWRKASMERRNSPTALNYIPEANNNLPFATSNMRGLQIKQPFQAQGFENTMTFRFSTVGYRDIVFAFAARNEGAAEGITVEYSVDGLTWSAQGLAAATLPLTADYQVFQVDFTSIAAATNSPDFQVRFRFYGSDMTVDNGNRVTFNNFSVQGVALPLSVPESTDWQVAIFPNPATTLVSVVPTPADLTYQVVALDGRLVKSGATTDGRIAVSDLPAGIYLLQLESEGKRTTRKLMKR
ncbi:CotH kinase family protein [Flavobacterium sp.]|uniref:CotH kinase family protein n=1 Tax=Flavobacterium sp. TaxID=239 RepID=UPI0022C93CFC|nr:CotH kinase family protein [Flavobacterium sp.]MCZ8145669.1 CotH kinase family protein [Flavobacterium sp.]